MQFYKRLSWWKGFADFFLYLVVISFTTKWITEEFYPIASIILFVGIIINLIFLIKSMIRK